MRFETVLDSDYSITKVSKRFNNGDFDYWLVLKLEYLDELIDEPDSKYQITIHAVSPDALGETNLATALKSFDASPSDKLDPKFLATILVEYGSSAPLWTRFGNNARSLWRLATREATIINMLFGFYMDRPLNALGATGWDWIAGNPLGGLRPLDTQEQEGDPL